MFIVSDCDEILDPQYIPMLHDLAREHPENIFKADLVHLEGRADMRAYHKDTGEPREWRYSLFVCMKKQAEKLGFTYIRADEFNPFKIVWPYSEGGWTPGGSYEHGKRMTDLGWHFSWMGSNENRLEKAKSFCHADWNFDFLNHTNYSSSEMKDFMAKYEHSVGQICPSGMNDFIMKPYSIENLPQIIFDLPRVKEFLLPDIEIEPESHSQIHVDEPEVGNKTEIEKILTQFSLDTENPENNFALGLWYEHKGHTAPALTYFLRCAERATDADFAYEALLKSHHCYDRQGTRDGTAISLLQQALCLVPKRPEAYFLLARFHERRQQWNDCYKYSSLALDICDFNAPSLSSDVEYPGKYGLIFEKAVSGYWWGKGEQSRELFNDLLENYEMTDQYRQTVIDNVQRIKKEK
jgi:tetratricopeptide (TPR) repeat protein